MQVMKSKPEIEKSALLIIDAQDSFIAGPRWQRRNNPAFEQNVSRLIEGYRSAGLPVFFFLDSDDTEHFHPGSPYFKLMDFIQPQPGEPILIKTSRNCFTTTNLDYLLRRADIKRVVVTGIKTEQCCETTTRVASDLGYDVDFITEATLTFPIPHPSQNEELSADEVVRRTEYALRDRFARITTVAEMLNELECVVK
ncbi:MAG TPA: cysteine hydrolase family protein [Pyrinomonadaceae bacterium]|nr:cysteine hydrolase family protein [Pyrinomonadaceae bacterium]